MAQIHAWEEGRWQWRGREQPAESSFPIAPDGLWIDLDNVAGLNGRRVLASFVCFDLKHIARLAECPLFDGTQILQLLPLLVLVVG